MEKSQLGSPTFVDVGEIVGFLKPVEDGGTGDEVAVDATFFSEPGTVADLGGVTSRADRIFDLLASLLPSPIADWPPDGSGLPPTQWFPINLADAEGKPEPTGVHVVLPADHHTDQPVIGVGLWHETKATIGPAEIDIVVYASFPFLHIDSHGVKVVLGSPGGDTSATGAAAALAGNPIRLGARVVGPTGQTPFGSTYSLGGIELDAELYLSGPHPGGFALHLIDTQPPIGDLVSAPVGFAQRQRDRLRRCRDRFGARHRRAEQEPARLDRRRAAPDRRRDSGRDGAARRARARRRPSCTPPPTSTSSSARTRRRWRNASSTSRARRAVRVHEADHPDRAGRAVLRQG